MLPGTEKRKARNSPKVNLLLSLTFHGVLILSLFYFAAREGLLGPHLRTITVFREPEKKPEPKPAVKPKEEELPKAEPKVAEPPKTVEPQKVATAAPPPASAIQAPPSIAPPPAEVSDFVFSGGRMVEESSDPVNLYKGLLEYSLRSSWDRPEEMDEQSLVAEVEVAVDRTGHIADPVWKKHSGEKRWDDSVGQAIAKTRSVSRAPPSNFPSRVVLRFDVVPSEPIAP
jgi:hypothetical protein